MHNTRPPCQICNSCKETTYTWLNGDYDFPIELHGIMRFHFNRRDQPPQLLAICDDCSDQIPEWLHIHNIDDWQLDDWQINT